MKLAQKLAEIERRQEVIKQNAIKLAIKDSMIEEFQGIATGIIADGVVNDQERVALRNWVEMRKEYLIEFPLIDFAKLIMSPTSTNNDILLFCKSVALDLSKDRNQVIDNIFDSVDAINFENFTFCITGEFAELSRESVEDMIESRGGIARTGVSKVTAYLVVGSIKSDGWAHGKWGRKIEKAIEFRKAGLPIKIITEETLLKNF